jgi:uncharacterized protein YvpB
MIVNIKFIGGQALKQVMKKGLLFIIVATFFNIIIGCTSQVNTYNETEKLVKNAETLSSSVKNEIDYTKRLKKDKEQAFAIPDQELVTKTESAYDKAKKSVNNTTKDKKAKMNNQLKSIKLVLSNASTIVQALKKGTELNQAEKDLVAFYTQNPLSPDLETKAGEFEKTTSDKDTLQKSLPSDWQKPFEENVLKDGSTVLQTAKAMVGVQKNLSSLNSFINQGNKTEINKKMTEIKTAIAAISVEPAKTALNARLAKVSKPYIDKIAQEARKAQEAQKVAAKITTGTTTSKSSSSTPSSSTKTLAVTQSPTVTLNVPYVSQLTPTYAPMGCEGASLLMGLKYKGYTNESLKSLLDKMPKSTNNPYAAFAGSPYKIINGVFQSIFPKPLTAFGQMYSSKVANATGYTTAQLKNELDHGNPVVIYVTLKFARPVWAQYNMGSAGYVNIVDNMHVMTLIGYNRNTGSYYVADPDSKLSSDKYWVSKSAFETSYNALKYAVVVR